MICKQYIILNHVFFRYESNLEPVTIILTVLIINIFGNLANYYLIITFGEWKICKIILLFFQLVQTRLISFDYCLSNSD